jgi:D-threo-aldose 1-dehydrogenase
LRAADFDVFMLAGRYTLLDQSALEELLPLCQARGASIVTAAPFNSGILATGARPGARYDERTAGPDVLGKVAAIEAACAEYGITLGAAAVQFPLTHPSVAAVAPGPRSVDQVSAVAAWFREPIPQLFWTTLKDTGLIDGEVPGTGQP